MIHNEKDYERALLEYEVLYNRFNYLTEEERNRLFQLEHEINLYDTLKYQKN